MWWIAFLDWLIFEIAAAPNSSVVGIETAGRARIGTNEGRPVGRAPTTMGLATVTPLCNDAAWSRRAPALSRVQPQGTAPDRQLDPVGDPE